MQASGRRRKRPGPARSARSGTRSRPRPVREARRGLPWSVWHRTGRDSARGPEMLSRVRSWTLRCRHQRSLSPAGCRPPRRAAEPPSATALVAVRPVHEQGHRERANSLGLGRRAGFARAPPSHQLVRPGRRAGRLEHQRRAGGLRSSGCVPLARSRRRRCGQARSAMPTAPGKARPEISSTGSPRRAHDVAETA